MGIIKMANEFYTKFKQFLIKYDLYEERSFHYIWDHSVLVDYREDDYQELIGNCSLIIGNNEKLIDIIPCLPYLTNDTTVAISIYAYVQALTQLPRIGKKYQEHIFYTYILPMVYEKLYILENANKELLDYEANMIDHLLKDGSSKYETVLKCRDELIDYYTKNHTKANQVGKKAKRLAKKYIDSYHHY